MNMKKSLLLPGLLMLLSGCQHLSTKGDQCEQSIRAYNRMVRWQEYEAAEKAVAPPVVDEYRKTFTAGDLKIADYRIKSLTCDVEKNSAEAVVEIDYYLPPSLSVKTIEDTQKWRHFPDAIPGGGRLVSPPPDLRK